jgi:hypothetical protein
MTYVEVAAGTDVALAIRSDGAKVGWGSLGGVGIPPPGRVWVDVETGGAEGSGHPIVTISRLSDGTLGPGAFPFRGRRFGAVFAALGAHESGHHLNLTRAGGILQAGSFETFGAGCGGSQPAARLRCLNLPRLGQSMLVEIDHLPLSAACFAIGADNLSSPLGPLPRSLAGYGMPGCNWRIRVDGVVLLLGQSGSVLCSVPVPNRPELVDGVFHVQALVPDPAAGNAAGAVVSAAATAVVGS